MRFLAGILTFLHYNPWTVGTKHLKNAPLNKMLELGKITQAEYETAINRELIIRDPQDTDTTSEIHSYFWKPNEQCSELISNGLFCHAG